MYSTNKSGFKYPQTFVKVCILLLTVALTGCGSQGQATQSRSIQIPQNLMIYVKESHFSPYPNLVSALQASDGGERWRYTADPGDQVENLWTDTGTVYITTTKAFSPNKLGSPQTFLLVALRATDGKLLWSHSITSGRILSEHGIVYVGIRDPMGQESIDALQSTNGVSLWHTSITGGPAFFQIAQGDVYVIIGNRIRADLIDPLQSGSVLALRANDGKQLWQYRPSGGISSLQVGQGIVYATTIKNKGEASERSLSALSATDGKKLWEHQGSWGIYPFAKPDTHEIVSIEGPNSLAALSTTNGSILWRYVSSQLLMSFTGQQGIISFSQEKQVASSLNLTQLQAIQIRDGHILWTHTFANNIRRISESLATDGTLYIGTQNIKKHNITINALRFTDGTVLWSYQQPRGLITSLYAQSGVLYLLTGEGQNSGSICALRSSTGDSLWCQMLHADPEGATLG